jgi:hypothetical protein
MLQAAIDNEVAEYLETHRDQRTETGRRTVVRNGYHPERELVSGIGPRLSSREFVIGTDISLAARFYRPTCASGEIFWGSLSTGKICCCIFSFGSEARAKRPGERGRWHKSRERGEDGFRI